MKRRIAILTEAQWFVLVNAARYIDVAFVPGDNGEGEGDITRQQCEAVASALKVFEVAPLRDIAADRRALVDVAAVAVESSCSCEGRRKGHAIDCTVTTHRGALDRIEALRVLFKGAI